MLLPAGTDKSNGLAAALQELEIRPREVVAVGDAENDRSFLGLCGRAVAVANALPALQQVADWVTPEENGAGVRALIERLLRDDDLRLSGPRPARRAGRR